ncbi:SLIT and NTRK-like protein 6 [Latimeria chalumnae]|uniref:SLIT and NTRK like family member 6 n=1 Tax=Latimeria chalumnae TaxID=7897 RepID=H2ZY27_LATCH|nr:PREDICTED: SLIT and NTRK-like protein 6 [Latimeria chalumnae]|eukprot:XP_006006873.1 PREDICTED: SLIT and NTRK-like protein 6 [Latimeria chalumnae]
MLIWTLLLYSFIVASTSQNIEPAKPSKRGSCDSLCSCKEIDGVLYINCDKKGIQKISDVNVSPSQPFHLTLLKNELVKLQVNDFADLTNAISLHLGSNNIMEIEPGTFSGLSFLKQLHINYNYLEVLKEDTFRGLENLEFLQADNNFIRVIEPGAFSKLNRLKVLILNDNAIEFLPANIFRFVPLTHLDLRGNQIQTLPYVGILEHIGRIMELLLEDNKWVCDCDLIPLKIWLENMPPQSIIGEIVCHSPPLLNGRPLNDIKSEVICSSRSSIDFEEPFKSISLTVTSAIGDTKLSTKAVPFPTLPTNQHHVPLPDGQGDSKFPSPTGTICPVPCHCNNHPLSGLLIHCQERNIKSLSNLGPPPQNPRKLLLTGNIIQALIKTDLMEYSSLELLHFGNNRIELIQEGTFMNLTNLQKLYLNGNYITRLTRDMFLGLQSLEYLYLEYNVIKEIHSRTFIVIPKLKVLYLNNNILQTLPPHVFDSIPLARLNLKNNKFVHLPVSNVLDKLESLAQIDLGDNPWHCSCDLVGLKHWVEKLSRNTLVGEIMCESPVKFAKKDLKSLRSDQLCPDFMNIVVPPTQSNGISVTTTATTTSTAASFISSITNTIPLSVLILGMLILFLMIVFCAAGLVVFVLHRQRRSKKKHTDEQMKDSSPVHLRYSMYGHKTTHHTTEGPPSHIYEQNMVSPIVQVYRSPPYSPKGTEQEEEEKEENNPKNLCRSLLEKENDSPLTSSNIKFRAVDQASEFIPLRDASSLYRNILEREKELQQLGITEYLRKNISQLQPKIEVHYPKRHEELKLMETIMYTKPRKVMVEQTKNEYFELKANLHAEPDYLEVLEQQA